MSAKQEAYPVTGARLDSLAPPPSTEATPPSLRRVTIALDTPPAPPPKSPTLETPVSSLRVGVPTHATPLVDRSLSANTEWGVVLMATVPSGVLAIEELSLGLLSGLSPEETPGADSTVLPTPASNQPDHPPVLQWDTLTPRPCCGILVSLSFNEVRFGVAVKAAEVVRTAAVVPGAAEASTVVKTAAMATEGAGGGEGAAVVAVAGERGGVGAAEMVAAGAGGEVGATAGAVVGGIVRVDGDRRSADGSSSVVVVASSVCFVFTCSGSSAAAEDANIAGEDGVERSSG